MDRSRISLPSQNDDNQSGTILASTPLKLTAGHDPPHQANLMGDCPLMKNYKSWKSVSEEQSGREAQVCHSMITVRVAFEKLFTVM
ncbi:unnamed protein product [Linum trigynum]|uniref:Uncharacterized protein n=1 Tax=Linum trigynum TaxID=586398 RepID=A0AAV2CSJ7_9ROSI